MSHELTDADPLSLPDIGDEAVRRSMAPAALEIFLRIMDIWQASGIESRRILDVAPETKLENLDPGTLSEEHLLRVSCVIGVYKALHMYWEDDTANRRIHLGNTTVKEMADRWTGLRNTNALFAGRTPLEYMAQGGLEAMRNVRRLLDAWSAGN